MHCSWRRVASADRSETGAGRMHPLGSPGSAPSARPTPARGDRTTRHVNRAAGRRVLELVGLALFLRL
eukprot:5806298-Prymnesium_polylepis.2